MRAWLASWQMAGSFLGQKRPIMKFAFLAPAFALGVALVLNGAPASAQDHTHAGATHASHAAPARGGAMHSNAGAMRGNAMHSNAGAMRGGAMHTTVVSRPAAYAHYSYGGNYNGYRPGYSGNGWAYTGGVHYWHRHHAYWRNNVWGYYGPSGIFITIPL
jgi:hypothetical protein